MSILKNRLKQPKPDTLQGTRLTPLPFSGYLAWLLEEVEEAPEEDVPEDAPEDAAEEPETPESSEEESGRPEASVSGVTSSEITPSG